MPRLIREFGVGLVWALALLGVGCEGERAPEVAALPAAPAVECDCELRSWVVAGRGRHLYLEIDCPDGYADLDGVVEFTSEVMRRDYVARRGEDGALVAPRVARMTPGVRLRPVVGDPKERPEARWSITPAQARVLRRDRVWGAPYVLIGANSNSAMAAALRAAGLELPERVRDGGGVFGEFPGIDLPLGEPLGVSPGVAGPPE